MADLVDSAKSLWPERKTQPVRTGASGSLAGRTAHELLRLVRRARGLLARYEQPSRSLKGKGGAGRTRARTSGTGGPSAFARQARRLAEALGRFETQLAQMEKRGRATARTATARTATRRAASKRTASRTGAKARPAQTAALQRRRRTGTQGRKTQARSTSARRSRTPRTKR